MTMREAETIMAAATKAANQFRAQATDAMAANNYALASSKLDMAIGAAQVGGDIMRALANEIVDGKAGAL